MSYTPKQASYHFEIGYDQYEVHFKREAEHYNITIFCNKQRKHDLHESLECSLNTAINFLTLYLNKKNNPVKLF